MKRRFLVSWALWENTTFVKKKARFAKRAVSQLVDLSTPMWTKGISSSATLLPHLSPPTSLCSTWRLFLQSDVRDSAGQGQGMRFLSLMFSEIKVKRTKHHPIESCAVFIATIINILLGWPGSSWVCLPDKRLLRDKSSSGKRPLQNFFFLEILHGSGTASSSQYPQI